MRGVKFGRTDERREAAIKKEASLGNEASGECLECGGGLKLSLRVEILLPEISFGKTTTLYNILANSR
jgi:hypothetical protein